MALKKETIEKLKALKLDPEKLIEAVKAEAEMDYEMPEVTALTAEELATRDTNKKNEGISVGGDLRIKDIKKEAGLDYTGEGSLKVDRLIAELTKKATDAANIPATEQVKTLTEQVKLLTKDKEELAGKVTAAEGKASAIETDYSIVGDFPSQRKGDLKDKEYLTLVKGNLEFKEDGVYKDGQLLRDPNTQSPISRKDAIAGLFTERKWVGEAQEGATGRGGSSSKGAAGIKPTKQSEAEAMWLKDNPGKTTMSAEYQQYVMGLARDNKDFALNE